MIKFNKQSIEKRDDLHKLLQEDYEIYSVLLEGDRIAMFKFIQHVAAGKKVFYTESHFILENKDLLESKVKGLKIKHILELFNKK